MVTQNPTERTGGLSRRDFLRGGAAGALAVGLAGGKVAAEDLVSQNGAPVSGSGVIVGPGKVPMEFRINGKTLTAQLEPRVTLLDALRDHLDLTGAKKVCDRATCGACTVLLDGKAVYACTVLAIEAQEAPIETIEGIGDVEHLHPVQAAFIEHDAQQCGFCTPGFVMACKALLTHNPRPSPEEVDHALGGNFCRCGTYSGIRGAIAGVAGAGGQGNG